jgi:hypothetical protein
MKNNKGVTMIMLVITIILMILIASFAVYYSNNIGPEARLAAQYSSLKEVKAACDNAIIQMELDPDNLDEFYFFGHAIDYLDKHDELTLDGKKVSYDEVMKRCNTNKFSGRTYVIVNDGTNESQLRLSHLELSNVSYNYVVDLDYQKYYLVDGVKDSSNQFVYELSDIEKAYSNLLYGRDISPDYFTEIP